MEFVAIIRTVVFITMLTMLEVVSSTDQSVATSNADSIQENTSIQNTSCMTQLDSHYRFTRLVYGMISILHWLGYGLLAYGLHKFIRKSANWGHHFRKKLIKGITRHLKENRCSSTALIAILLLFLTISWTSVVIGFIKAYKEYQQNLSCRGPVKILFCVTCVYHILTIVAHTFTFLIRFTIAVVVIAVHVIWFDKDLFSCDNQESLKVTTSNVNKVSLARNSEISEDWKIVSRKHYECTVKYDQRRDKVSPFYAIYQSWFVLQWLIYFFAILTDVTHLLRPLVAQAKSCASYNYAFIGSYILYGLLAFCIPYACGMKMNTYHRKYYEQLKREQLEASHGKGGSIVQHAYAHMLHVQKQEKCDFVPYIMWTGISIPLNSPGYIMGTLLTIFALVGTLTGFKAM